MVGREGNKTHALENNLNCTSIEVKVLTIPGCSQKPALS